MNEEEFIANEKKILAGIGEKGIKARTSGLECKLPADGKSLAGYIVYLEYGDEFERKIGEFSDSVYNVVNGRAIKYGIGNAHQTIGDFIVGEIPTSEDFNPDAKLLDKLSRASQYAFEKYAEERSQKLMARPWMEFRDFVASSDSVIIAPMVGFGQHGLIEQTYQRAANLKIPVEKGNGNYRKAWGRHSTVSRFTENIPANEAGKLFELMDYSRERQLDGPNQFEAVSLNVGYFTMDKEGFDLRPVNTIWF